MATTREHVLREVECRLAGVATVHAATLGHAAHLPLHAAHLPLHAAHLPLHAAHLPLHAAASARAIGHAAAFGAFGLQPILHLGLGSAGPGPVVALTQHRADSNRLARREHRETSNGKLLWVVAPPLLGLAGRVDDLAGGGAGRGAHLDSHVGERLGSRYHLAGDHLLLLGSHHLLRNSRLSLGSDRLSLGSDGLSRGSGHLGLGNDHLGLGHDHLGLGNDHLGLSHGWFSVDRRCLGLGRNRLGLGSGARGGLQAPHQDPLHLRVHLGHTNTSLPQVLLRLRNLRLGRRRRARGGRGLESRAHTLHLSAQRGRAHARHLEALLGLRQLGLGHVRRVCAIASLLEVLLGLGQLGLRHIRLGGAHACLLETLFDLRQLRLRRVLRGRALQNLLESIFGLSELGLRHRDVRVGSLRILDGDDADFGSAHVDRTTKHRCGEPSREH